MPAKRTKALQKPLHQGLSFEALVQVLLKERIQKNAASVLFDTNTHHPRYDRDVVLEVLLQFISYLDRPYFSQPELFAEEVNFLSEYGIPKYPPKRRQKTK